MDVQFLAQRFPKDDFIGKQALVLSKFTQRNLWSDFLSEIISLIWQTLIQAWFKKKQTKNNDSNTCTE